MEIDTRLFLDLKPDSAISKKVSPPARLYTLMKTHIHSSQFHNLIFTLIHYTWLEDKTISKKGHPMASTNITSQPKPISKIKMPRKTAWIAAIFLMLAIAGGYTYYSNTYLPSQTTTTSPALQTVKVRQGDLIISASGSGTLIGKSDASFGFGTNGQVTEVYVKVGDRVEAGQVLARLDDTLAQMTYIESQQALHELYSAASIAIVQKEIATAKDTEFQARTWLEYLISPDVVEAEEKVANAGQKLADAQAEAKANPSDAANQKVKESEAALTYLREKLTQAWAYYENVYLPENFTQYVLKGRKQVVVTYTDPNTGIEVPVIDKASIDDIAKARNNIAQAQQIIKDGETYLEVLKTGVIPKNATGGRLNNLYGAQLLLNNAKTALDAIRLAAPISGTVTSLNLHVGEQVTTSSIITISQLNQPYVLDANLDESDWSMAQVGNKVNVTFDLLPQKTFAGTVTMVYPELDTSSDSPFVRIVAQLDQSISQNLPMGTGASVDVVGGEANGVLLVPVNAIHKIEGGKYAVYIIQDRQQVEQEVEIGLKNESYAEVKSGLEAGEIVMVK